MKARTYSHLLAVLILLLSVAAIKGNLFAQQLKVEGEGTEFVVRPYLYIGRAFLQNFSFEFLSTDRDIQVILVDPTAPDNHITLGYFDDSRDDEYSYKIAHQTRDLFGVHYGKLVFLSNGKETLNGFKPGPNFTFVLIGFQFSYRADPHHIDEIGVLEEDGFVTVFFNDKNDDDPFLVIIQYAWIPNGYLQSTGVVTGSEVHDNDSKVIDEFDEGIPIISGFKFDFEPYFTPGNDHHLRKIGVLTSTTPGNLLEVSYADQNGDDGFDWEVRWATLFDPLAPLPIVEGISVEFTNALTRNDTAKLDSLLDDDLIFIDGDGAIISKTDWLMIIKSGNITYQFNNDGSNNVQVFGNTAAVTDRATVTKLTNRQRISTQYRFTRIYLFDGERSQVVAIQLTPLDSSKQQE